MTVGVYTLDQCEQTCQWFVGTGNADYDLFAHIYDFAKDIVEEKNGSYCIRVDSILRWNHLSSFLTEDLLTCAYLAYGKKKRVNSFDWCPYLLTDCDQLNDLLHRPLADIHSHLKGSSLNFDVNWICLMNHISNRSQSFEELEKWSQYPQRHRYNLKRKITLYEKAILAAALRLRFFSDAYSLSLFEESEIKRIVSAKCLLEALSNVHELQAKIDSTRIMMGFEYEDVKTQRKVKIDYAIDEHFVSRKPTVCDYSVLAGERFILYSTFDRLHRDKNYRENAGWYFYLYLLIKNEIRQELIQNNDSVGFENFNVYERRKTLFVDDYPIYEELLVKLAVASFFENRVEGSTHETRIAPKEEYSGLVSSIVKTESFLNNELFGKSLHGRRFAYDYHFIKVSDKTKPYLLSLYERYHDLRRKVKNEALNISRLRKSHIKNEGKYLSDRIVGIDAANSEILTRPEVFAQAFRFLRGQDIVSSDIREVTKLGITYHVGEDFIDVVDGLRAVDELLHYMNHKEGDRLGHALVLGVDIKEYYSKRNFAVCMTKQMRLDNIVWLHHQLVTNGLGYKRFAKALEELYKEYFADLYGKIIDDNCPIGSYYDSWLLRGDNPEMYTHDGNVKRPHLGEWNEKALNEGLDSVRLSKKSCLLYYLYHYCADLKKKGAEYVSVEYNEQYINAISTVQAYMLRKVERQGIAIECNPTSNFKIGEINRYDQHPIAKFYSYKGAKSAFNISASINTDDKGIFSTSIEREYALIYAAYKRKAENDRILHHRNFDIIGWLDNIRKESLKQSFIKNDKQ